MQVPDSSVKGEGRRQHPSQHGEGVLFPQEVYLGGQAGFPPVFVRIVEDVIQVYVVVVGLDSYAVIFQLHVSQLQDAAREGGREGASLVVQGQFKVFDIAVVVRQTAGVQGGFQLSVLADGNPGRCLVFHIQAGYQEGEDVLRLKDVQIQLVAGRAGGGLHLLSQKGGQFPGDNLFLEVSGKTQDGFRALEAGGEEGGIGLQVVDVSLPPGGELQISGLLGSGLAHQGEVLEPDYAVKVFVGFLCQVGIYPETQGSLLPRI